MNVSCDHCNESYQLEDNVVDRIKIRANCKSCGNDFFIPSSTLFAASASGAAQGLDAPAPMMEDTGDMSADYSAPVGEGEAVAGRQIKWMNSIQARMSAILILISTLIFGAFVLYNYSTTKKQMAAELNTFAEVAGTRLSKALVNPVWALDDKQIDDILLSEMLDNRIIGIYIVDRDGKTSMGAKQRDSRGNAVNTKSAPGDAAVQTKKDIATSEGKIGHVEVYLTDTYMKQELTKSVVNLVITAVVLNIAILLTVMLSLRKMVTQPIGELTEIADKMSMGDLNVKIDVRSRNEIGSLSEAINRMQASLRLAIERLRKRL